MTLRRKILLLVTFVIALVTAMASVYESQIQLRIHEKLEEGFHSVGLANTIPVLEISLWIYDEDAIKASLRGLFQSPAILRVQVFDTSGKFLKGFERNSTNGETTALERPVAISEEEHLALGKPPDVFNQDPAARLTHTVKDELQRRITGTLYYLGNVGSEKYIGRIMIDYSVAEGIKRAHEAMWRQILTGSISAILMLVLLLAFIRKFVLAPVMALVQASRRISQGNFSVAVAPTSNDEVGLLAEAFDDMRSKINDFTENLQHMVLVRTIEVLEGKNKIEQILIHIEEGILTFGTDLIIDSEFSHFLGRIYDIPREKIAGTNVIDLVVCNTDLPPDKKSLVETTLLSCLGEAHFVYQMNKNHLPRDLVVMVSGKHKILSLEWKPILNTEKIVVKMMLTIKDVTRQKELEIEIHKHRESNAKLMQRISELIRVDKERLSNALTHAEQRLMETDIEIKQYPNGGDPNRAFIQLHTLKGDFRILSLSHIVEATHEAENIVTLWRENKLIDAKLLLDRIADIRTEVKEYHRIFNDILGGESHKTSHSFMAAVAPSLAVVRENLHEGGVDLESVEVIDGVNAWKATVLPVIADMVLHAVNNAVDHGYVLPKKRNEGVPPAKLRITARLEIPHVIVEILDCGAGVSIPKLKEISAKKGFAFDDSNPYSVLFADGFSSAEQVTQSSGRGVGLSAIKAIAEKFRGGAVAVRANSPQGTVIRIELPVDDCVEIRRPLTA